MELKELRNFMQVARAGSVSRAAEELRLAQPALSRQIKKLEHELGVSLFTRHGRGVRLSAAGSLLLERAEAITHLVHQTSEEIKDDRSVDVAMTLTTPNCPAAGELPTMVENAVASVPGVGVVSVNVGWEPVWSPERMSDEARLVLNMW